MDDGFDSKGWGFGIRRGSKDLHLPRLTSRLALVARGEGGSGHGGDLKPHFSCKSPKHKGGRGVWENGDGGVEDRPGGYPAPSVIVTAGDPQSEWFGGARLRGDLSRGK